MALQNKNRKQGARFSPSSRYSAAAEMDSSLHGHIEKSSSGEVLYFISRFPIIARRRRRRNLSWDFGGGASGVTKNRRRCGAAAHTSTYKSRKKHQDTDALSRCPIPSEPYNGTTTTAGDELSAVPSPHVSSLATMDPPSSNECA